MFRFRRFIPVVTLVLGLCSGCGSKSGSQTDAASLEDSFKQNTLAEVGSLFGLHKTETTKPAKSAADFAKFEPGLPGGYKAVKDRDVLVLWGATVEEGATDKILAYEKSAPESGGYVVMQDGTTVKRLSAEEFKSSPKAPGSAEAGKP